MKISVITWLIIIFGIITFLPLMYSQVMLLIKPNGRLSKDLIIGKNLDWRDKTHQESALAFAWADLLIVLPTIIIGTIGILSEQIYGYLVIMIPGAIAIYFSLVFWVMEKKYSYTSIGYLAYYTYYWGSFLYWGVGVLINSILTISSRF